MFGDLYDYDPSHARELEEIVSPLSSLIYCMRKGERTDFCLNGKSRCSSWFNALSVSCKSSNGGRDQGRLPRPELGLMLHVATARPLNFSLSPY